MLRHLTIEERHGGIVRIANGSGTVDVTGRTLDEAFVNAMDAARVVRGPEGAASAVRSLHDSIVVLDDLLGTRGPEGR